VPFCGVAGKEKKANLKIVKYLHFPFTGYAEFVSKAKQAAKIEEMTRCRRKFLLGINCGGFANPLACRKQRWRKRWKSAHLIESFRT
jgi:hypothetical protein